VTNSIEIILRSHPRLKFQKQAALAFAAQTIRGADDEKGFTISQHYNSKI
jgi:hypothetical protein